MEWFQVAYKDRCDEKATMKLKISMIKPPEKSGKTGDTFHPNEEVIQ